MVEYRAPHDEIASTLRTICDLDALAKLPGFEHADPDTLLGVVEEAGRFFSDVVAPLYRVGDEQGSVRHDDGTVTTPDGYRDAYDQYVRSGWGAVPFPAEYGGGGFPWLTAVAIQETLMGADLSFSMAPLLTQGAIDLLLHHGDEVLRETYLPKMVSGEWAGTMNLTEPQAGSDVGALSTRAEPTDDGSYRLTGTKIFITFGEHDLSDQIVHLVLARTPDAPPGTKGISCFVVPKHLVGDDGSLGERNGVRCLSIEHKMGIKASPTCVLEYDGAVGYLIGEENQGMRYMFTMMNNARLSVGLQGLALGERAWQQARAFASERRQGRAPGAPAGEQSPIVEHPDVARMLLTMRSTVSAVRALCYECAQHVDLAARLPDDDARERAQGRLDVLIPIAKAWSTDMGVELTSLNIQIHGGMGYIEETGAAQPFRDSRIAPIYEGTNGIQAMDLVGRKLPQRGGAVIEELFTDIEALIAEVGQHGELSDLVAPLEDALAAAREAVAWLMEHGLADPRDALAGATPFQSMMGLLVAGWLLARLALTGDPQRVADARFFVGQQVPRARGHLPAVTAGIEPLAAADLRDPDA